MEHVATMATMATMDQRDEFSDLLHLKTKHPPRPQEQLTYLQPHVVAFF